MQVEKDSDIVLNCLKYQKCIEIPSEGYSMFPLIQSGSKCTFQTIDPASLNRGDIVLFMDKEGYLVGHRFLRCLEKEGHLFFICKGDTNLLADEPITSEKIIGKLIVIKRENRVLNSEHFLFKLWGRVVRISIISKCLRFYVKKWVYSDDTQLIK